MRRTPDFWQANGWLAHLLEPLGLLYGAATAWRLACERPWRAPVPVVCVGNLVAGGAGKTPVALAIARRFNNLGVFPVFVARGYGGKARGPLQVILERDGAERVGDEVLLLAAQAPTIIAYCRADGARLAASIGAQVIVMDDGHQHPTLHQDVTLVVVDGGYAFGNSCLLPAGPLREPVERGLARASALVVVGEDEYGIATRWLSCGLPVLQTHLVPGPEAAALSGQRVVAFAGIGRPEKFFATLQAIGAVVIACHPFADHKPYTALEIQLILEEASALRAIPVTTAKDAVRLTPAQRQQVVVFTITIAWQNTETLDSILTAGIRK
ncbi:Tetraacyldisaccharide 4'-kinase [invertebrate metagenome]|uniref:tetraacyldisaccharide 4'-kinase n=1 Tax=invertebrate metagenome TaxID=1711999 RepID=A0A484H8C4_9ZZZZ